MKAKNLIFICLLFSGISGCSSKKEKNANDEHHHENGHDHSAHAPESPKPGSPKQSAMANVGAAHIHIEYSSPSVRGRVIWGGLVAYDQIWVTGAHQATSINFPKDVKIENHYVPAGKYALFTIPGKERWIVIINKNWEQHLTDEYNNSEDILRFTVVPDALDHQQESLTYEVIESDSNKGQISMSWAKLKISFDIEVI